MREREVVVPREHKVIKYDNQHKKRITLMQDDCNCNKWKNESSSGFSQETVLHCGYVMWRLCLGERRGKSAPVI